MNNLSGDAPNIEYRQLHFFAALVIQSLRIGYGDFAILSQVCYLGQSDSIMFWIIFFFTVLISCIIFLNFIVAEASGSYNEVNEKLEEFIQMQRASMIGEAEQIIPDMFKNEKNFPRYIILRKLES